MKQSKRHSENADLFEIFLKETKPHITMKDKTQYRSLRTAIVFVCEKHGEYIAKPSTIKETKHGCKFCGSEAAAIAKTMRFEDFVKQSHIIHGENRYIYDESSWRGSKQKTKITCTVCNTVFLQTGNSHLSGSGCMQCANEAHRFLFSDFIKQAKITHGDRYIYEETTWRGTSKKTRIFCKTCEKYFEQTGSAHLKGRGCATCNSGGFDNENNFARNLAWASSPCKLYYIKINGMYKIGITKSTLAYRYSPQQFETLLVRETTRLFAWRAEQMILSKFAKYKQNGDIGGGSTECFGIDISELDNFYAIFNSDLTQPLHAAL